MTSPEQIILVHLVEDKPHGYEFERHRNEWPLHITLVPWFKTYGSQVLDRNLSEYAAGSTPIKLRVGEKAMFGVDLDTPVNIIANQKPIAAIHNDLRRTVAKSAGVVMEANQQYSGSRYRAHVTRHEPRAVEKGEIIEVDNFNIVRLISGNTCRVEKQYLLGKV